MHIHLIAFKVLHRVETLPDGSSITHPPEPDELGSKDVVNAYPGVTTCVKTSPFDIPGTYVVHCHILEHEDWEMMQTFDVQ